MHRMSLPLRFLAVFTALVAAGCGFGGDEAASSGGRPGGGFGGPPGGARSAEVPVEVIEIATGPIAAYIETNGALEAEREVDIVARIGGPIAGILTEEGEFVRAGEVIARVDDTEARAQVEIARVALEQAQVAWNRARTSFEQQVVSQEVHDSALSAFESARAQLEGNQIQYDYTRIVAPFDGLIVERAIKFGETVTAGQRLFRISDFEPLLCHIAVPERDLTRVSPGQSARIEVEAYPGEEFEGRVIRVSPVVDAATGTVRVTLEVDRQERLSPGMFANVRLVTDVRPNALIMPRRALSLESLADAVFVVEDGLAARRNVTLGYEDEDMVEVAEGLRAGDRVIVVGQDGLTDATPVQILAGPGAAEEPASRTAGEPALPTADRPGMTPERRERMAARMRERGMSDGQIRERLAAMAAGGGRAEGPPEGAPPSPPMSPEEREAERQRLRDRGMTEEQIRRRLAFLDRSASSGGEAEPDGITPESLRNATDEELRQVRERLRERGLTEEQIREFMARVERR